MHILLTLASIVIVIAGLQAGRNVIIPVVLACFLAIISYPATRFLRTSCHLPHWLSVFLTVVLDFCFLTAMGFLVNYLAHDISSVVPKYNDVLTLRFNELVQVLKDYGWGDQMTLSIQNLKDLLSSSQLQVVQWSASLMSMAASILTTATLVLILMTFFLGEAPKFRDNLSKLTKRNSLGSHQLIKTLVGIQKYLVIKTCISIITGFCAWLICIAVGIDLPLLWAMLAFLLNYIPTFGSIVAAIPPILISLIMLGTADAFIVTIGYIVINMALGQFIEPMLLGRQFGIATSVVLLSVIFWGWMWGPVGMLVAVPITMLIKLGLESSDDLRWVAQVMGSPIKHPRLPGFTPRPTSTHHHHNN